MLLSATTRSVRSPELRSSLESILGYLQKHNVESAGKTLRLLVDSHPVARGAFTTSQEESAGGKSPALSIATLGARIALDRNELKTAADLAKLLHGYHDATANSISPTVVHVISGLLEVASRDSLSYATSLVESVKPQLLPHDLIERFYDMSLDQPDFIERVWTHIQFSDAPRPSGRVLLSLLKKLNDKEKFGDVIYCISMILKSHPSDAKLLPPEIPIELAPQVITLASRAGASQQSFRLWELAVLEIGHPSAPATTEQARFFGDSGMTYALVRHFMKLAEKNPNKLKKWHKSQLAENPKKFVHNAEQVYNAFATIHGFEQGGYDSYLRADHYHVSTSIACLFALNQFAPALEALQGFFRRNELPDEKDFAIILSALARRNAGRAIQILLEAAPARIPGFTPTPFLYNIVLHHALLQGRDEDAVRVMTYAKAAGCGSLDPKSLDVLLRAALKKVEQGWKAESATRGSEAGRIERKHLFKRIIEVINVAQHHTRPSTLRLAIETALQVQRPIIAWNIWMLGKKYRRLGTVRNGLDGKDVRREDFGPGSAWDIAKGLWSAKKKGVITEAQMWKMVEEMKIRVPEGAKQKGEWTDLFNGSQEGHNLPEPTSFRRSQ